MIKKDDIFELHKMIREEIFLKWNRVLPLNEEVTDRWEKADFLGFGKGTSIYDTSIVMGDVKVGENTWIGPYTLLDGTGGGIIIGDYCSISSGVQIYTHDTVLWSLSGGNIKKVIKAVTIGNNCYVAPMSLIGLGVEIGECSIVAANSFVNESFPQYSIIAGTPAKRIGEVWKREDGTIELNYYK